MTKFNNDSCKKKKKTKPSLSKWGIKTIYRTYIINIRLNSGKLDAFPKIGTKANRSLITPI